MSAPAPDLWLFFLLVAGVILLPGMDMAYVATSAVTGGWRSGAAAVAGIVSGGLIHVVVASTGIALALSLWPAAFNAVLLVGAVYMAWIGGSLWRAGAVATASAASDALPIGAPTTARVFGRAVLTCLLNPKAYAFMLAVFPAFVQGWDASRVLRIASIVAATQIAVYGSVAMAAARTRRWAGGARTQRTMLKLTGPLLMVGALATVLLGWKPALAQTSAASPPPHADGSHDFDFLIGNWHVANRKRLVLLQGVDRWESFEAESHVRVLPGGIGNMDEFVAPQWRPGYVGVTLRVYSPQSGRWSLFWLNNRTGGLDAKGQLLEPVVGRFKGDEGVFEGDDEWEGRPIRVRYLWRRVDAAHAHWEQAFSLDRGKTWEANWICDFTRLPGSATAESGKLF